MNRYRDDPEAVRALVREDCVHRDVYLSPEIFELEMRHLWRNTWIYVGHDSQVPNAGDYVDSGWIDGNGGSTIYHVGATATLGELRICATDSTMNWQLIATLFTGVSITGKPRILVDNYFSVIAVLYTFNAGTVCQVSRDGGVTWSDRAFYRSVRALNGFGLAQGRLFSSFNGELYSTMQLGT